MGEAVKSNYWKIAFLICLILALMMCRPTSTVPAKLILHAPMIWISYNGGMPCMYGNVTNVGGGTAYNGRLYINANEGEREYIVFLGDIDPGETIPVEENLEGYTFADDVRCTYRLGWDYQRLLVCVSMDSDRLSGGD